jgi:small subunit ribosomal protein S14
MAKKSSIEKNNRRRRMTKKFSGRRARLKAIAQDKTKPVEERSRIALRELGSKGLIPGLVKSSW